MKQVYAFITSLFFAQTLAAQPLLLANGTKSTADFVAVSEVFLNDDGTAKFQITVTNKTNKALSLAWFALPAGAVAVSPAPLAPKYEAAASATPFYSIRFKTLSGGIKNGQKETFSFSLPLESGFSTDFLTQFKTTNKTYSLTVPLFSAISGARFGNKTVAAEPLVFNAQRDGATARLAWVSRTAATNDRFFLERSADDENFETIAELNAAGADGDVLYFEEADAAPLAGDNFYRLRLQFLDGSELFSDVQKLVFQPIEGLSIFPNPATDAARVDLKSFEGRDVRVSVLSLTGQPVRSFLIEKAAGESARIGLDGLDGGAYFIRAEADGQRSATGRLMIEKGH